MAGTDGSSTVRDRAELVRTDDLEGADRLRDRKTPVSRTSPRSSSSASSTSALMRSLADERGMVLRGEYWCGRDGCEASVACREVTGGLLEAGGAGATSQRTSLAQSGCRCLGGETRCGNTCEGGAVRT